MSCALLDVNVMLALLDPCHIDHDRAQDWFARHRSHGWATCPITQNGYLRIASQPRYTNPVMFVQAVEILRDFCELDGHRFWPDDISLLDGTWCNTEKMGSHRRVTDTYLLALALRHGGVLATLDTKLGTEMVIGGEASVARL